MQIYNKNFETEKKSHIFLHNFYVCEYLCVHNAACDKLQFGGISLALKNQEAD